MGSGLLVGLHREMAGLEALSGEQIENAAGNDEQKGENEPDVGVLLHLRPPAGW